MEVLIREQRSKIFRTIGFALCVALAKMILNRSNKQSGLHESKG